MPTLSGSPPLSPEQMAALRGDSIAMQLILSGAFDERIAELNQIQADITLKQEALIALDEANSVRADADAYAATAKAKADSLLSEAQKAVDMAANRADEVGRQQKAIDAAKKQLQADQAAFESYKQNEQAALQDAQARADASAQKIMGDISLRETVLKAGNDALSQAQDKLAADQAEVASMKAKLAAKLSAFAEI